MSEVTTEVEPRLQYILNDPRFILDSSELDTEGMSDIIYTDDNQAIILNGEIIEDDNTSTFILQNDGSDLSHYITNNDTEGEILIANLDPSNIDQYQDSQHIIQYVDEDGNVTNAADVVYVNEDGIPLNAEDISSHYQMELMEIGQSTCDEEQIKDDRIINFECVSDKKGDHSYGGSSDEGEINAARIIKFECVPGEQEDNTFIAISPADWYQYTQAKDGLEVDDSPLNEYQYTAVQNNTFFTVPSLNSNENANTKNKFAYQLRDVPTAITGKNLITGQIVTLDSYMDKIKDRIKSNRSNSVNGKCRLKHNLNAFLNKKFNLGLTVGGKNLIAKIIHVSSKQAFNKNQEQSNEICGPVKNIDDAKSETEDRGSDILNKSKQSANTPKKPVDPKLMCVQTKLLSKKSDQFQRISKILSDLMKTEKVKNQLLNKSIHIDIVDKYCYNIKNMVENVSFISGYMEKKVISTKNELVMEEWVFVPDTLKTHNAKTNSKKQSEIKYPNIIGVTVVTTHKRDKDYVKILLDSSISIDNLQCRHCGQLFQTINNMRVHINSEHIICEICDTMFETREALLRHKRLHPKNSKEEHLKHCNVDHCGKYFLSDSSYQQHLLYHKLNPNSVPTFSDLKACEICDNLFIDEDELADHKKTHIDNISFDKEAQTKYYACEICKRTFSRMANLQRHVGIHKEGDQLFSHISSPDALRASGRISSLY